MNLPKYQVSFQTYPVGVSRPWRIVETVMTADGPRSRIVHGSFETRAADLLAQVTVTTIEWNDGTILALDRDGNYLYAATGEAAQTFMEKVRDTKSHEVSGTATFWKGKE